MDSSSRFFFDQLECFAGNTALVEGDRRLTYVELAAAADDFASELGSGRKLIFLEARNTIDAIISYAGCLRAGHVVYLFGEGDEARVPALIETYRPNRIIRHGATGRSIERKHDELPILHPDLAILLSTSGSTGSPKFVKLSKRNITANALSIAEYLGLDHSERAVTTLKFNYSYGMSVVHSHLATGGALILTEDSVTTPGFWERFAAQGGTSFAGVPYSFEMLQRSGDWAKIPSLRYATQAGGRLAPDIVRHMADLGDANGWRFFVMYGQTEAAPRMAYLPPDQAAAHPDCMGRAVPGGVLSLIGEDGKAITAVETPGELVYSGPNVMMGYASGSSDLAGDETPPHLATGDIAVRTNEGLFRIVGRSSRFIKPFGVRVNLDELQAQIQSHAAGAICTGGDAQLVVAVPGTARVDIEALVAWIGETYKLPRFLIATVTLAEIPRLANGKVDYQAILKLVPAAEIAEKGAPAGKWASIHDLFKSATGAKDVQPDSSFVTLAADSLSYVVTSLAIEDYLGFLPAEWETLTVTQLEALKRSPAESQKAESLHYLNTSRIVLLLLGIPYHASLVFREGREWRILSAPQRSEIATLFSVTAHSFRMFAFFLISGYFSMLILRRTPAKTWLRKQAFRLGIPAVFGSLVLGPLEIAAMAIQPGQKETSPLAFWLADVGHLDAEWLTHRWFLLTLLSLCLLLVAALALTRVKFFSLWLERADDLITRYPKLSGALFLLATAPYGLASALLGSLTGDKWGLLFGVFEWRSIISYAPAFFLGVFLLLHPKAMARFLRPSWITFALGAASLVTFILVDGTASRIGKLVESANWIACGLLCTRLFVSLMHRWLNRPSPWIARLLDASYVIYMWHMVFVLLFAGLCIRLNLNPLVSIILISALTYGCSWLVYLGVARSRILSLIFNGGPLRAH